MDNQHRLIKGYRELSEEEIAAMNAVKEQGERLGKMIEDMQSVGAFDQRWVSLAKTHFQMALMFATRAVAKPTNF